jgi:hypothetical protein
LKQRLEQSYKKNEPVSKLKRLGEVVKGRYSCEDFKRKAFFRRESFEATEKICHLGVMILLQMMHIRPSLVYRLSLREYWGCDDIFNVRLNIMTLWSCCLDGGMDTLIFFPLMFIFCYIWQVLFIFSYNHVLGGLILAIHWREYYVPCNVLLTLLA